ncbi:homing endonuclease, partial [Terfezia boudieri ATCC MYA-4762]
SGRRAYSTSANRTQKLDPYFITGLVDGEGYFCISICKNSRKRLGWQTNSLFGIGLHKKDRATLELIQAYFNGIGRIHRHGKDYVQYFVCSRKDLALIIAHFDQYPLITQKRADFELFKQTLELINRKEHLTEEGLTKILSIRASVNNGLSDDLKTAFPNIIPVARPQVELPIYINPHWLAGFASRRKLLLDLLF